ncbi:ATP-binding protein [Intrasporangium chromatireducens Q5-1]|uniref:ATP-binding protein n=1 Tax=Intrasporangium chromatireducens Q5-1 TaxID=584657 RepID=W9GN92_9MICO|nr:ATP-binding protein [Intrasporangium chromatireducens]EWT05369.1 ATP-binding protein [Intrasporangium chromatireducens Q5-1]
MSSPRAHTGLLYTRPENGRAGRSQRRALRAAKKRLTEENNKRLTVAEGRGAVEADRPMVLPPLGEHRPEALRSLRRLRLPAHRATSDVLAGAYPFLAEAGLGEAGVFIGQDAWSGTGFCFDPWVLYEAGILTNPNCLLAGAVGKGKSCLAKSIATRSIALGRRIYVPGDPKGEWTAVAERVGGATIALGPGTGNRLNPLDPGPRHTDIGEDEWIELVATRRRTLLGSLAESALGRALTAVEHTALDCALTGTVASDPTPTLPRVVDRLLHPRADAAADGECGQDPAELARDGRELAHALRRLVAGDLAGLFDGPSTVDFDPSLPMVTLDLSRIHGSDQLTAMVMTCASAWMEAALTDPNAGARWIIYDEAWRLIRQPALLARMQAEWKLSRGYGIANLLIIHRLSDLDAVGDASSSTRATANGLLADCATKIVYQQEPGETSGTARRLGLTSTEEAQLPDLRQGEGLWHVGQRAFIVRHFATANELDLFDTNQRMTLSRNAIRAP